MGSTTVMVSSDFGGEDPKAVLDALAKKIGRIIGAQMSQTGLKIVSAARAKVPSVEYHSVAGDARMAASLTGGSIDLSGADGFNDDTGNLRSSIGFIVAHDGKAIMENFKKSSSGTEGAIGLVAGQDYAKKLCEELIGWSLTVVAGMHYAGFVEALGYDVITGSTLGMEQKLKRILKQLLKILTSTR